MERTLQDVISHIKGCTVTGDPKNKIITDLTIDSRTAGKGSLLFVLLASDRMVMLYRKSSKLKGRRQSLWEKGRAACTGTCHDPCEEYTGNHDGTCSVVL